MCNCDTTKQKKLFLNIFSHCKVIASKKLLSYSKPLIDWTTIYFYPRLTEKVYTFRWKILCMFVYYWIFFFHHFNFKIKVSGCDRNSSRSIRPNYTSCVVITSYFKLIYLFQSLMQIVLDIISIHFNLAVLYGFTRLVLNQGTI